MTKFESSVIVKRTLQAEFGHDTPNEDTIRRRFQCFCKTDTVEDHQCSVRPSTITEEKVDEIRDVCVQPNPFQVFDVSKQFVRFHKQHHIEL